ATTRLERTRLIKPGAAPCDPLDERWIEVRWGARRTIRRNISSSPWLVSLPPWGIGRRQDVSAAPDVHVAAPEPRTYSYVQRRYHQDRSSKARANAAAHRHRLPGLPPARSPHRLGKRCLATAGHRQKAW